MAVDLGSLLTSAAGVSPTDAFAPHGFQGEVARLVRDRIKERLSVKDFGALGDGSGDTVTEWLSGGTHDRGYADLVAIQVDFPEVTSLSTPIDQAALMRAMNVGRDQKRSIFAPEGTYIISPRAQRWAHTMNADDQWFILYGDGPRTVIKRADKGSIQDADVMIDVRHNLPNPDTGGVLVADLMLHGNATGNPLPADWAATTAYALDDMVTNSGGNNYICVQAGTSGSSEPTGTGTGIADGSVLWDFVSADGNGSFAWEHSADCKLAALSGSPRLVAAIFRNVYGFDPLADTIWFSNPGLTIDTLLIDGMRSWGRTTSRGDIQLNIGYNRALISNCSVARIEWESGTDSGRRVITSIVDCVADTLEIGMPAANKDGNIVHIANSYARRFTLANVGLAHIVNSTIGAYDKGGDGRFVKNKTVVFDDCLCMVPENVNNPELFSSWLVEFGLDIDQTYIWRRCRFEPFAIMPPLWQASTAYSVDDRVVNSADQMYVATTGGTSGGSEPTATGTGVADGSVVWTGITGTAMGKHTNVATGTTPKLSRIIEDCSFDPRFSTCIGAAKSGRVVTRRNRFHSTDIALTIGSDGQAIWLSEDDDFSGCPNRWQLDTVSGTPEIEIEMRNGGATEAELGGYQLVSALSSIQRLQSNRVAYASSGPPTGGGLEGDRVRLLTPVAGQDYEWICTASDPTAATWKVLTSVAA